MELHPDQRYIEAIRQNDTPLLRQMIAECYPPVEAWICKNNGTREDAKDMFGHAMEAICSKLHKGGHIELQAQLATFIFSICRFQWLKRLRRKKIETEVRISEPQVLTTEPDGLIGDESASGLVHFIRGKITKLGESCQRLLDLCWSDQAQSMEEIAKTLGFASANYVSKRKHECLAKLKQIIHSDPKLEDYL